MVKDADKMDYICTTSIGESDDVDANELEEMGMVIGHAYALIAVQEVVSSYGDKTTILQIRNPWGRFEWQGAWSDNSDLWTQASRK